MKGAEFLEGRRSLLCRCFLEAVFLFFSSLDSGPPNMADDYLVPENVSPRSPRSPRADVSRLDLQIGRPCGSKRYVLLPARVAPPSVTFSRHFVFSLRLTHLYPFIFTAFLLHPLDNGLNYSLTLLFSANIHFELVRVVIIGGGYAGSKYVYRMSLLSLHIHSIFALFGALPSNFNVFYRSRRSLT